MHTPLDHFGPESKPPDTDLPQSPPVIKLVANCESPGAGEVNPESLKNLPQELREAREKLVELTGKWNPVEICTPAPEVINRERTIFLANFNKGVEYTPQYEYSLPEDLLNPETRRTLNELRVTIRSLKTNSPSEQLFRFILLEELKDAEAIYNLAQGMAQKNEEAIQISLATLYPKLEPHLVEEANRQYQDLTQSAPTEKLPADLSQEEISWLEQKTFSPQETADAFSWALKKYGLLKESDQDIGFRVEVSPDVTSIDVRDRSEKGPIVLVPAVRQAKPLNGKALLGLIAHEIEGHARQSMNGEQLFLLGGGRSKVADETLYEGLALRHELAIYKKLFGEVTQFGGPPALVLAAADAENGSSFSQIFANNLDRDLHIVLKIPFDQDLPSQEELKTTHAAVYEQSQKTAFLRTHRVLRGHTDLSNKDSFANTKDLAYLWGQIIDTELCQAGLGHINEAAVIKTEALPLMSRLNLKEDSLPFRFLNVAESYWHEVLKPQFIEGKTEK